jgi:2-methylcitrate dehydratase PrpD
MAKAATSEARDAGGPVTRTLVEHTRSIQWSGLPADVREIACQCVLDWIGVALAGSVDALPRLLIDEALAEGGKPLATVVGHRVRIAPLQAALINGSASHVLDYDDVNLSMNGHPTAAILPALLALGEARAASGGELIAAFIAGYEIACRVGLLVAPAHYARGYHATCTVGAIAAAAGCARLLKLDAAQTAHAIGIGATQASGLKSMFGTQCKPFHAGLAAHNGLRAARLAASGMAARDDALECAQGFASTLSSDFNPKAALAERDLFHVQDNLFKYHASCFGTHASIECVRQLREANSLEARRIKHVTVRVERGADAVCNIAAPQTALEAKFSLRFMTAAALLGSDTSDLALFNDAMTREPGLCAMRDKVKVELMEGWPMMQSEVIVELDDGRSLRATHDAGIPSTDYVQQGERLRAKFERLAEPVLGGTRCRRILELVDAIDRTAVVDLMSACGKQG